MVAMLHTLATRIEALPDAQLMNALPIAAGGALRTSSDAWRRGSAKPSSRSRTPPAVANGSTRANVRDRAISHPADANRH